LGSGQEEDGKRLFLVGYGHKLRVHGRVDVRVLKAQLDLIAQVIRSSRWTTALLALGIAVVGSGVFGYFGATPVKTALSLPAIIAALVLLSYYATHEYQRDMISPAEAGNLESWFSKFMAMQIAISAGWGLMPWLLWDKANIVNHLFLATCVCCVMAKLVMSRANQMDLLVASLVPMVAISSARFLLGGTLPDFAIALALPAFGAQFFLAGRRLTLRLDEESRLRFEVEDLARELEETRDEALRKRFEAETANASKTAFLANMSHELRTPLNAILGFSEIIQTECFGPVGSPRYIEYAGDIHTSGTHLLSLINDLLDVAKIEAGKMEIERQVLDVKKTFESALKIIAIKARERKQRLVIDIDPATPPLDADERAATQILINLVSNAVKFTPDGGRIAVGGTRSRGGDFQLLVEDNGPGIPREKLDRVFKPFSQIDNRYDRQGSGTGLGLALVRGLAELHGGRAWIESDSGKGCRAYVIFPGQPVADNSNDAEAESARAVA
jgi:two-component system cell cycle sensor histidine kinase PleC